MQVLKRKHCWRRSLEPDTPSCQHPSSRQPAQTMPAQTAEPGPRVLLSASASFSVGTQAL